MTSLTHAHTRRLRELAARETAPGTQGHRWAELVGRHRHTLVAAWVSQPGFRDRLSRGLAAFADQVSGPGADQPLDDEAVDHLVAALTALGEHSDPRVRADLAEFHRGLQDLRRRAVRDVLREPSRSRPPR